MVRSGRGDDLEIAGDRSVRRSTHEAWDAHQIDACCVHQVLTDRHPSVPEGVVDHFRHATRDHVRTACRSQADEAGNAVRHGNDHPSLRLHDDTTRTGNDRDDRSPLCHQRRRPPRWHHPRQRCRHPRPRRQRRRAVPLFPTAGSATSPANIAGTRITVRLAEPGMARASRVKTTMGWRWEPS
jgi:hypothetical protein